MSEIAFMSLERKTDTILEVLGAPWEKTAVLPTVGRQMAVIAALCVTDISSGSL